MVAPRERPCAACSMRCAPGSDLATRIRTHQQRAHDPVRQPARETDHRTSGVGGVARPSIRSFRPAPARDDRLRPPFWRQRSRCLRSGAPAVAAAVEVALGLIFLAWTVLRLLGIVVAAIGATRSTASYRSAGCRSTPSSLRSIAKRRRSNGLVAALRKLNYPLEKLDIKLVLEPDDHDTQSAVAAMRLTRRSRSLIAPEAGRGPNRRRSTPPCRSPVAISSRSTTPKTGRSPISFGLRSKPSWPATHARLRSGAADDRQHV